MDEITLKRALGDLPPIAKGVARLYKGEKGRWTVIDTGMLVWQADMDGVQTFKLLRISDGSVLFEEELYENFGDNYSCEKTTRGTHQFHTMELAEFVAGVCFANDADANGFKNMLSMMPKAKPMTAKEKKAAEAEEKKRQKEEEEREKKEAKEREKAEKAEAKAAKKRAKEEKKRGGGAPQMEISAPTNFQHVTHIGWDEAKGFQVENLPPEWKNLFKTAGIKRKDLENKDTAKLIVETLTDQMTDEQLAQMPALPGVTDRRASTKVAESEHL